MVDVDYHEWSCGGGSCDTRHQSWWRSYRREEALEGLESLDGKQVHLTVRPKDGDPDCGELREEDHHDDLVLVRLASADDTNH